MSEKMVNEKIGALLTKVNADLDEGRSEDAVRRLNDLAKETPEWVDSRFLAELTLIEKQIRYQRILRGYVMQIQLEQAYDTVREKYASAGSGLSPEEFGTELPEKDTIWWCWLQGEEEAPEIAKSCLDSLRKLKRNIVILDESSVKGYVQLPEEIEEKRRAGVIGNAHYSDLIRINLLNIYGGTWVDATAYFTGDRVLDQICSEDLFMFRSGNVSKYIIFDNWLMHAGQKSRILEAIQNMLFEYWMAEEEAIHYFIFHLFCTMACHMYPEEYEKIPLFSNEPSHILQNELGKKYSDKRWNQIREMTDIHKLTYKVYDIEDENTFYRYILNRGMKTTV